jgi:hypothetical protein
MILINKCIEMNIFTWASCCSTLLVKRNKYKVKILIYFCLILESYGIKTKFHDDRVFSWNYFHFSLISENEIQSSPIENIFFKNVFITPRNLLNHINFKEQKLRRLTFYSMWFDLWKSNMYWCWLGEQHSIFICDDLKDNNMKRQIMKRLQCALVKLETSW